MRGRFYVDGTSHLVAIGDSYGKHAAVICGATEQRTASHDKPRYQAVGRRCRERDLFGPS